jgi:hypothetical protein
MTRYGLVFLAAGGALLAVSAMLPVLAQDQGTVPATPPPAGTLEAPPEQLEAAPPVGTSGTSSGTLSEQLDRSQGVITPPEGVDPGLVQTPPNQGATTMPVIPPPGTPGGNPNIQPK